VAGGPGGPDPARDVGLEPCAVAFAGVHLLVGQQRSQVGLVSSISMQTGRLTNVAGAVGVPAPDRTQPPTPNGTLATDAILGPTCGVAVDHTGNLLVSDSEFYTDGTAGSGDNMVRVVAARTGTYYGQAMRAGRIYTIVGDGKSGSSGDGGPAISARLHGPAGLAVGSGGAVIVAASSNDRLRAIAVTSGTFYGQHMTAGDIYTIAGRGVGPGGGGDGGPATKAQLNIAPRSGGKFDGNQPTADITTDAHGNVVLADTCDMAVADTCTDQVQVVAASAGRFYGQQMKTGDIYRIGTVGSDTALNAPSGVAVDAAGNVVVTDTADELVKVIAARSGRFYGRPMTADHTCTIAGRGNAGSAGDGGLATKAEFAAPYGVTTDSAGNVVIADSAGNVVIADSAGNENRSDVENERVQLVAARSGRFYGVAMKAGHIYTIGGFARALGDRYPGNGTPAAARQMPTEGPVILTEAVGPGIAADKSGNALIAADYENRVVVGPARSGRYYGQRMTARDLYTVAGGGSALPGGGRLAATTVRLNDPSDVKLDSAGNLPIADFKTNRVVVVAEHTGRFYGQRMRSGRVYRIAGNGKAGSASGGLATKAEVRPVSVGAGQRGSVIIGTEGRVAAEGRPQVVAGASGTFYGRRMTAGHIYTVADTGQTGRIFEPLSVVTDRAGNIVFASPWKVFVVAVTTGTFYGQATTAGHEYVIAGDGNLPESGDGGPATEAGIEPSGVALDAAGNVLIADGGDFLSGRLRVVAESTGTFYGQSMVAGDIYTIAGGGTGGLGNGGPALRAEMDAAVAVAVEPSGAVLVSTPEQVRLVSG
jgi:hypothetical protein